MTWHRLENSGWRFESSCFACDERNERALAATGAQATGDDAGFLKG